MYTTF